MMIKQWQTLRMENFAIPTFSFALIDLNICHKGGGAIEVSNSKYNLHCVLSGVLSRGMIHLSQFLLLGDQGWNRYQEFIKQQVFSKSKGLLEALITTSDDITLRLFVDNGVLSIETTSLASIFLERHHLLIENENLKKRVAQLEAIIDNYEQIDEIAGDW